MSLFDRRNRKMHQVVRRIGESVGVDGSVAALCALRATPLHSLDGQPAMQAAELVILGYQLVEVASERVMGGSHRRLFRAMTPESGKRASVWLAHGLGRPHGDGPWNTNAICGAYELLGRYFPLVPEDEEALSAIQSEVPFPLDQYPRLTEYAIVLILGQGAASGHLSRDLKEQMRGCPDPRGTSTAIRLT